MERIETFVSVVVICRNVADYLEKCIADVCRILEARYSNYEVVLVDDHSEDGTLAKAESLLSRYPCVRAIALSRRVGPEIATMAGLESAIGDFVVTVEPDRDPTEDIAAMVELVRQGNDIVIGTTDTTSHRSAIYRFLRGIYLKLANRLIQVEMIPGNTTFSALSRQAVNAMTRIRRRKRLFALVAMETGYSVTAYPYRQQTATLHRRDRRLWTSIRRGISILVVNSNAPLRLVSGVGLAGSMLCLLYGVYIFAVNLVKSNVMEGWTTLSLQMSGLFFLVFLMLALMGEYMARVLDESMDRPLYHLRSEKTSSIMISNTTRRNVLATSVENDSPNAPPAAPKAPA